MSDKTILEQWRAMAYDQQADRNKLQQFWAAYFNIEKGIYEQLLSNPDEVVSGTVKELAEKYGQDVLTMVGFLDGINDSLKVPNPIDMPDYCYFRDRCELSCDKCQGSYPGVIKLSPTHEVSCYRYADRPEAGWLANVHPGEEGKAHE